MPDGTTPPSSVFGVTLPVAFQGAVIGGANDSQVAATVVDQESDYWYGQLVDGATTLPRINAVNASANVLTSELLRLGYFTADRTKSVSTARLSAGSTAAGATPTLVRIGLWTADAAGALIALVASTANDTALLAVQNTLNTKALSAAYTVVKGQRYAAGALCVTGAAAPTIVGASVGGSTNAISGLSPRLSGTVASQTDLPASVASGSITDNGAMPWIDFV